MGEGKVHNLWDNETERFCSHHFLWNNGCYAMTVVTKQILKLGHTKLIHGFSVLPAYLTILLLIIAACLHSIFDLFSLRNHELSFHGLTLHYLITLLIQVIVYVSV